MTGINRVFVPDYVIVEFAEEATRKAHRICQEWIKKISESESWETCRNVGDNTNPGVNRDASLPAFPSVVYVL